MVEKLESIQIIVQLLTEVKQQGKASRFDPIGAPDVIDTPYAIVCYEKGGMDLLQMPGISMTRADGILAHFLQEANKYKNVDKVDFDMLKITLSIKMQGSLTPTVIPIDCERALIIFFKDNVVNHEFRMYGMDMFTAYGTMDFIKTQMAIGSTFQNMAKQSTRGIQMPGPGMPIPQVDRHDPRFRG